MYMCVSWEQNNTWAVNILLASAYHINYATISGSNVRFVWNTKLSQ